MFSPQQEPYVPPFVPPTSPTFVPFSVGPTMNVGLDPSFQTMMMEMMRQNSRLIELMDRRLTAEKKRREEEEAARKAATTPYAGPIGDPLAVGSSSSMGIPSAPSSGFTGNRAEKYLPQIPILDQSKMGKSRMVEVEEWLRFTDVFSAWPAMRL